MPPSSNSMSSKSVRSRQFAILPWNSSSIEKQVSTAGVEVGGERGEQVYDSTPSAARMRGLTRLLDDGAAVRQAVAVRALDGHLAAISIAVRL